MACELRVRRGDNHDTVFAHPVRVPLEFGEVRPQSPYEPNVHSRHLLCTIPATNIQVNKTLRSLHTRVQWTCMHYTTSKIV
jgi:hypothetical protein